MNPMNDGKKKKIAFSWSGGKDSALGLLSLIQEDHFQMTSLFTTLSSEDNRVPFHETTRSLLEDQLIAIEIPYDIVSIPLRSDNKTYESTLASLLRLYRNKGISEIAFADLFLEDIRTYRETLMKKNNLIASFPLWGAETSQIALNVINSGIRAVITCVDQTKLSAEWLGREYNESFLNAMPKNVDPCGENGEFHTFVYDAPFFKKRIPFKKEKQVTTYDERFAHLVLNSDN